MNDAAIERLKAGYPDLSASALDAMRKLFAGEICRVPLPVAIILGRIGLAYHTEHSGLVKLCLTTEGRKFL